MSIPWRSSYAWKRKRKEIRTLYKNKCAICGSCDSLEVHHIISMAVLPQLKLDNNNLILLCSRCHKLVHNNIISSTNLIQKVKRT